MDSFDRRFLETAVDLVQWRERRGGMWPSRTATDEHERKLATWLGNQRLLAAGLRAGRWTEEREAFLDNRLPQWREESLAPNLESEFAAKVDELSVWVSRQGRWPQAGSPDPDERRMWNRLSNIRRTEKGSLRGRWNDSRRILMDTCLPGWRGNNAEEMPKSLTD